MIRPTVRKTKVHYFFIDSTTPFFSHALKLICRAIDKTIWNCSKDTNLRRHLF